MCLDRKVKRKLKGRPSSCYCSQRPVRRVSNREATEVVRRSSQKSAPEFYLLSTMVEPRG